MAIKGSLKEASLPDVIQLLSMGNKTGVLSITDRQNFGNIYLKGGKIVYAYILNRKDRIGDMLVAEEIITKQDLQNALTKQNETTGEKRLGTILVEMELISYEKLHTILEKQVEGAVYNLLTWKDGYFNFEPDRLPNNQDILVSLSSHDLMLEGVRRIDEWKIIRKEIPSLDLIPQVIIAERNDKILEKLKLNLEAWNVISLINGENSAQDIINITEYDDFDVCKTLQRLIVNDIVKIVSKKEVSALEISKLTSIHLDDSLNLGLAFFTTDMYDEAEREFQKVLNVDSNHAESNFYLALISLFKKHYHRACDFCTVSLKINKYNERTYNNLGVIFIHLGKLDEAEEMFQKALERNDNEAKYHTNLGIVYYKQGRYEEATKQLHKAIKFDNQLPIAYFHLALALMRLGDIESSLAIYNRLLEFNHLSDKDMASIYNNLGLIYEAKKQDEKALIAYEKAEELDKDLAVIQRNLGDLYYRSGRHNKALSAYEKAIADGLETWELYFRIGNIFLKRGNKEGAISEWKKSLELNPNNDVLRRNLSLIGG